MATPQEKAQCVLWFIETKSDLQTQRNFGTKYGKDHVHRFVHGTRYLWGQGQCSIKDGNIDRV